MTMTSEPILYTYEAAEHCPACTVRRFGKRAMDYWGEEGVAPVDAEGNDVHATWWSDLDGWQRFAGVVCDDCGLMVEPDEVEAERQSIWMDATYASAHAYDACEDGSLPGGLTWAEIRATWESAALDMALEQGSPDSVGLDGILDAALSEVCEAWRAADLAAERATYGADLLEIAAA